MISYEETVRAKALPYGMEAPLGLESLALKALSCHEAGFPACTEFSFGHKIALEFVLQNIWIAIVSFIFRIAGESR